MVGKICIGLIERSAIMLTNSAKNKFNLSTDESIKIPLVTVLIVVYNGIKYIETAIESVLNQTYQKVELIIIDGGSTDGTIDVLKKYDNAITHWISEKDSGIYDAMNKALRIAGENMTIFLGSDDAFYDEFSLEKLYLETKFSHDVILTGVMKIPSGVVFNSKHPNLETFSDFFEFKLHHQGFLFKNKKIYFDLNKGIHSDCDHMIRLLRQAKSYCEVNQISTSVRTTGVTAVFKFGNYRSLLLIFLSYCNFIGLSLNIHKIVYFFLKSITRSAQLIFKQRVLGG